jgi:hypothetical protein
MGVLAVKVCSSLRPAALQIAHRAAHTPSNQLRRTRPRSAMSASHRNLPVRKQRSLSDGAEKNGRRPRSMSERLRNHYYAMFDTRPRRAFQAAASRLHRLLGVDGKPVSRSKRPVRGPSDDPEGPAAVLGVSMSSPALALPRSSPRVYGWPFWTYGSSMVRAKLQICLRRLSGRGSSGSVDPIVLPSSICARAVPLLPGLPRLL